MTLLLWRRSEMDLEDNSEEKIAPLRTRASMAWKIDESSDGSNWLKFAQVAGGRKEERIEQKSNNNKSNNSTSKHLPGQVDWVFF